MRRIAKVIVALAVTGFMAQPALADDQIRDGASDAANGFLAKVQGANAVVLRVPVNAQGEENTSAATMRLYAGETRATANSSAIETIWNSSTDIGNVPKVTDQSIRDGATWGWGGYRSNYGWQGGYNYYNYRPYAYYYGNYYNYTNYGYNNPYYYTNYTGNYGYRYYYWCY